MDLRRQETQNKKLFVNKETANKQGELYIISPHLKFELRLMNFWMIIFRKNKMTCGDPPNLFS